MITIVTVSPTTALAADIVWEYMADVAAQWYQRPATDDELSQALRDEPYGDLQGPTGVLLVAVESGRPVGCAGVRFLDGVAELTKVFAVPAHRGRGIGSRLLRAAEQICRQRSMGTVRLDTRAALAEACAMYERNGYERVAPFNDQPYSDRWYSKTLAAGVR